MRSAIGLRPFRRLVTGKAGHTLPTGASKYDSLQSGHQNPATSERLVYERHFDDRSSTFWMNLTFTLTVAL
jgi:hypothetical protein